MKTPPAILCLLVLAAHCLPAGLAPPAASPQRFSSVRLFLEFLRPEEAAQALRHIIPEHKIHADGQPGQVRLIGAGPEKLETARALLKRIDVPRGCRGLTMFVEIEHHQVENIVAAALKLYLPANAGPPLHVIPQPRTSRVFLMGPQVEMARFADLLQRLDRPPPEEV